MNLTEKMKSLLSKMRAAITKTPKSSVKQKRYFRETFWAHVIKNRK